MDKSEYSDPVDKQKLLRNSAREGNVVIVEKLIKEGVELENLSEKNLLSLLRDSTPLARQLIAAKAGIPNRNEYDYEGHTILTRACDGDPYRIKDENIEKELVEVLLHNGADINKTRNHWSNWSPLAYAAFCGNLEVVKLLVSHGADVTINGTFRDEYGDLSGNIALIASRMGRHKEIEEYLHGLPELKGYPLD